MEDQVKFLNGEDIALINMEVIYSHNHLTGDTQIHAIRDFNALDSIEGVVQAALFYSENLQDYLRISEDEVVSQDISGYIRLAAYYLRSIIGNHVFTDGNKRTGFVTMQLFFDLNELPIDLAQDDAIEIMQHIAKHNSEVETIATLIASAWICDEDTDTEDYLIRLPLDEEE